MGKIKRLGQRLWGLTAPRTGKPPVIAISDSHAHFCENCRCFVKITLWCMETCPNCESDQIKFAAAWMRTPGEQSAHAEVRKRQRFVKALSDGKPLPQLNKPKTAPLPKRTVLIEPPSDAA